MMMMMMMMMMTMTIPWIPLGIPWGMLLGIPLGGGAPGDSHWGIRVRSRDGIESWLP